MLRKCQAMLYFYPTHHHFIKSHFKGNMPHKIRMDGWTDGWMDRWIDILWFSAWLSRILLSLT